MSDQAIFNSEKLIIPIYVDTDALLGLLAAIQDGFSFVEKVTTRTSNTEGVDKKDRSLQAELNVPNLLKIGVNPAKSSSTKTEGEQNREANYYHTYASLLHKLIADLDDNHLIKRFDGTDKSWESVKPSDFVELRGLFRFNPFVESLNILDKIMNLAQVFSPNSTKEPQQQQKRKQNQSTNQPTSQLDQIRTYLDGMRTDLETESIKTFIITLAENEEYKAVTSIFIDYLRDKTLTEIANREFRVLGKVVRNIPKTQSKSIDLLAGTGIGSINKSIIDQLLGAFSGLNSSGINLPEVETAISSPVMQIIPIAIYV